MTKTIKITDTAKLSTSKMMDNLRKKFKVYSYWDNQQLNEYFPKPEKSTTRYFKLEQERSDFKGNSWNEMDKTYMMTFREYILFFYKYYKKTGKHADETGWTVFKKSLPDGRVACGGWGPSVDYREVVFYWLRSAYVYPNMGARLAIPKS